MRNYVLKLISVCGKEVQKLFSIGDKIVYGFDGVFTVSEYSSSPIDKNDTRQFYVLRPVHGPVGNIIMTPVENEKLRMRAVMSRDNALSFIDSMPSVPTLSVEKEKNRRDVYRKALEEGTAEALVRIIKTVMLRREELSKIKKRTSESDNDYEKKAKYCLNGELAVSLNIPVEEVDKFIEDRLSSITA